MNNATGLIYNSHLLNQHSLNSIAIENGYTYK